MLIIDRLLLTKRIIRDLHIQRYTQTPPPRPRLHTHVHTRIHTDAQIHIKKQTENEFLNIKPKYKTNLSLSKMPLQSTNITIMMKKK